jgi:hypothetical protein
MQEAKRPVKCTAGGRGRTSECKINSTKTTQVDSGNMATIHVCICIQLCTSQRLHDINNPMRQSLNAVAHGHLCRPHTATLQGNQAAANTMHADYALTQDTTCMPPLSKPCKLALSDRPMVTAGLAAASAHSCTTGKHHQRTNTNPKTPQANTIGSHSSAHMAVY